MTLTAADKINRQRRADDYRRGCGKPRRRRSEGTGEACILLRAVGVREVIPGIDPDVLKFWLIAVTYADELGTAWAAQKEFMRYGYSARSITQYFEILDSLGLIRFIRKGERDRVTRRMLHNVYQFHPALVYIRKALREQAAALSPTPFESRFSKPILKSREKTNHNQVLGTNTTNQHQDPSLRTTTNNGSENGESRFSPHGENGESEMQNLNPQIQAGMENLQKSLNANRAKQPRSAQPRSASVPQGTTPTPPHSPPAPPPGSALYRVPLPNASEEKMAQKLNMLTGNMSMHTARYLVFKYGTERCSTAVGVYTLQGVDTLQNPGGFLRSIIERGAVSIEDEKRGQHFAPNESEQVNLW